MSIRVKLIGAFAFSMVLMISLGMFVLWIMDEMSADAQVVNEIGLPSVEAAATLHDIVQRYRLTQWEYAGTSDDSLQATLLEQQRSLRARMDEELARYRAIHIGAGERAALERFEQRWRSFAGQYEQMVHTTSPGSSLMAMTAVLEPLYSATAEAGLTLRQISRARASEATQASSAAYDTARSITIATLAITLMFSAVVGFSLALDISDGLRALRGATQRVTAGDLYVSVPTDSEDELGALGLDFQQMLDALRANEAEVARQQQALVARAEETERAARVLQQSLHERDRLIATVRAMSSPVLPVKEGVVIAPLIGVVDQERAADFSQTLLTAVERQRAHSVIIDLTGLAIVDSQVARALLDVAHALRLLGARTILVGIRPELAQTLVGVGVSLEGLVTRADLRSGVSYATRPW